MIANIHFQFSDEKCIEVIVADLLDNFMNIGSLFKIIFLIVF